MSATPMDDDCAAGRCSLEEFVFNVATVFLRPKEYYFFKIFVLCNRFSDLRQSVQRNNVYNQHKLFNYVRYGPLDQRELEQLDEEGAGQDPRTVDDALRYLFDKGFITRSTTYVTQRIEYRTPLTFKPAQFVKTFSKVFAEIFEELRARKAQRDLQRGNSFVCAGPGCRDRRYTDEEEHRIREQNRTRHLSQVVCPHCHGDHCVARADGAADARFEQTYALVAQLRAQSAYLRRVSDPARGGDEEQLDRELRALRAEHNEKVGKQQARARRREPRVDRRRVFRNRRRMTLREREEDRRLRLGLAERGLDADSVFERPRGPVYKAPRYYQGGAVGAQRPEWLDSVYRRAERILHAE